MGRRNAAHFLFSAAWEIRVVQTYNLGDEHDSNCDRRAAEDY